jgi:hypothetical protein
MDSDLNALVGEWEISGNHPQLGSIEDLGRMWFEWMAGEKWLIQRWESGRPEFPSGLALIGPVGESPGSYRQNYFDSRGVERLYEMSLSNGMWVLERRDDDFWQRFRGDVGPDLISGAWEKAEPGGEWELDFGIDYRRVR